MKDLITLDDRFRYLVGCVKSYVHGKKPLSWILPKIRGTDDNIIKYILDSEDLDIDVKKLVLSEFKI